MPPTDSSDEQGDRPEAVTRTAAEPGGIHAADRARVLHAGQQFGPFLIVRLLGRGGMGEVWEADHIESGRRVAIKVLTGAAPSEKARRRFLREGQLAAQLSHPNTVFVFGSEEVDGTLVNVMEVVLGGTLRQRVEAQGPLPPTAAVDAILDVIAGLRAAAQLGILHRDVKPANCFVAADGRVKIGDFGVSVNSSGRDWTQLTRTGTIVGTPAFASPEQLRGEPLDARADIYSVGATLYYLLLGAPPFRGSDAVQLISHVLTTPPVAPHVLRPSIDPRLGRLVLRCLAKIPSDRPSSYESLLQSLEPFSSRALPAAGVAARAVAAAIDISVLRGLGAISDAAVGWPLGWSESGAHILQSLVQATIGIAYFGFQERWLGGSVGKRLCGLTVTSAVGRPASLAQVLVRSGIVFSVLWVPNLFRHTFFPDLDPSRFTIGSQPGWLGIAAVSLLFVTARRSNGWRGLHELLSNTATFAEARRNESVPTVAAVTHNASDHHVERCGPYRVVTSARAGETAIAIDDRLRRRVWIRGGDATVTAARRQLDRPTRFRWLAGRHTATEHWDAYEFVEGMPLTEAAASLPSYEIVSNCLADLASECRAATVDRSLSSVSCHHLWLTTTGRLMVADWPIATAEHAQTQYHIDDPRQCQLLLSAAADLWSRARLASGEPLPVPLYAVALQSHLRSGAFSSLDEVVDATRNAASRESTVSGQRRAAAILLPALMAVLLIAGTSREWAPMMPTNPRQVARSQLNGCLEELRRVRAGTQPDPNGRRGEGASVCVAALAHGLDAATIRQYRTEPELNALLDEAIAAHSSASLSDLDEYRDVLPPQVTEQRSFFNLPTLRLVAWQYGISMQRAAISLGQYGLLVIVLAAVLKDGPLYRLLGITVRGRNGEPAARWRVILRAAVNWLPVVLAAEWVKQISAGGVWSAGLISVVILSAMAVGARHMIRHPHHGLPERLTRTCLVRR